MTGLKCSHVPSFGKWRTRRTCPQSILWVLVWCWKLIILLFLRKLMMELDFCVMKQPLESFLRREPGLALFLDVYETKVMWNFLPSNFPDKLVQFNDKITNESLKLDPVSLSKLVEIANSPASVTPELFAVLQVAYQWPEGLYHYVIY